MVKLAVMWCILSMVQTEYSFSEGRREPGNIGGSNRSLPARHHSCDKQRTLLLLW